MNRYLTYGEIFDRLQAIAIANHIPGETFEISYATRVGEYPAMRFIWRDKEFSFDSLEANPAFAMLDYIEGEMVAHYEELEKQSAARK